MDNDLTFITQNQDISMAINGTHDIFYVFVSIAVAIIASYAAFQHIQHFRDLNKAIQRYVLLSVAALTMGGGMWAMHFLAMLAIRFPVPISFDPKITVLSAIPAVASSALSFHIISRPKVTWPSMAFAAVIMGGGVGIMHYMGMAAMQSIFETYYDPMTFAVSIFAAITLAFAAIFIHVHMRRRADTNQRTATLVSALAMGIAITAIHHIAMQGAYFIPTVDYLATPSPMVDTYLIELTALGVSSVLALSFLGGIVYRYMQMAEQLSSEVQQRKYSGESLSLINRILFTANSPIPTKDIFEACLGELLAHTQWTAGRAYFERLGEGTRHVASVPSGDTEHDFNWSGAIPSDGKVIWRVETTPDNEHTFTRFIFPIRAGKNVKASLEFITLGSDVIGMDFVGVMETICLQLGDSLQLREDKRQIEESEASLQDATAALQNTLGELEFQRFALDQHAIVSTSDVRGNITYVNDKFCEVSGYSSKELMGKNHRIVKSDEHPPEFYKDIWDTISSGDVWRGEMKNRAKDGTPYWVSSTIVPFLNDKGKAFKYVSIRTDITERIAAQEELQRAKVLAEQANESKSAFLATMSHEIRTPMNGVVGMIDILDRTSLNNDQKHMLGTARDSAYALLHIINDILDFSKIEAGKLEVESAPISLRDVTEGVLETLLPNADIKAVSLEAFISPKLPTTVMGDQVRLRQILFNIIGNAIKFTDNADTKDNVVSVVASEVPSKDEGYGSFLFSITDTGVGMSDEELSRLFQPFTQADSSTVRRFGGTGLGLSICKQLVDIMGGHIEVESEVGVGTTFNITLPLAPADANQGDTYEADVSGVNVLLALDDPESKETAFNYLLSWDAQVHSISPSSKGDFSHINEVGQIDVVITCSEWEQAVKDATKNAGTSAVRYIVLTKERTHRQGIISDDTLSLNAFPLLGSALRETVAVAVGRASPVNPFAESSIISDDPLEAMSVEDAEKRGQLILIAEDNETNQEVLCRQLAILGCAAVVADDGEKALELWRTGRFGLLLTDCHMPVMDGFELTAAVRAAEADSDRRTPIIAITANALSGEAERCIERGMDDFLTKPVELKHFKRKLKQWLPERSDEQGIPTLIHSELDENISVETTTAQDSPIDPTALASLLGGDPALHHKFLKKFITPSQEVITQIDAAHADRNAADLGELGHKLKSSARAVGANALADACAALEAAGRDGDWETLDSLAPQMQNLMADVEHYIDQL